MTALDAPLKAGATIGILGGGQLGRMLALAGAELGFDIHIYEPEADCPAGRVAAKCVSAPWDDLEALGAFAAGVDVLTFEFENVPLASLNHVGALKPIRPGIKSLELTKDRLVEKRFINGLGLETAPFFPLDGAAGLDAALESCGQNGILKTRQFGYDGKGQIRVTPDSLASELKASLGDGAWLYEGLVDFSCEVSVILARSVDGTCAAYDVTQNVHRDGILNTSIVPASIDPNLAERAIANATILAEGLSHIGVMAVEFFVAKSGDLLVNEIAPRVHNSGHWTQDGCNVCQFQQHMRAVAGWPLGDPSRHAGHIEMTNLIGEDVHLWQESAGERGAFVHLYGKRAIRAGRKMGHINRIKAP